MMIRSVPPASAHLADSPVPAPAPMITPPESIVARSLARASSPFTPRAFMYSSSLATIACANSGSLMFISSSISSTPPPTLRSSSNSAASASGSWKGWPSASIIETPPSGRNSAVGPFAAESLRAIRRPSSAFSSSVVRMSVIDGLCT